MDVYRAEPEPEDALALAWSVPAAAGATPVRPHSSTGFRHLSMFIYARQQI